MPPRQRTSAEEPTPADNPDVYDGPPEDDPALADPDADGPSPRPADVEPEPEPEPEPDVELDPDAEYVVLVDALSVKTGKNTNDTMRLSRGNIVKFKSPWIDVKALLRAKAIAPNDGEPKKRTTAAVAARAQGAADDPVPTPRSMQVQDATPTEPPPDATPAGE